MGRKYDGEKHVALETEKSRLEGAIATIATKMQTEYASDKWDGEDAPGKVARYSADNITHMRLSREVETVEAAIDRMEAIRPISRSEHLANPILDIRRRWCMRGADMLDEGERQVFMPEMTGDMAKDLEKRGVPATGEFFDPWAIATDYSKNPLPPTVRQQMRAKMAVGDPSRSDISTESATGAADALGLGAPETWAAGVVESLQYFGSVAANCHNFNTSDGNKFHQNSLDTKDEEGEMIADQSQVAGTGAPLVAAKNIGNVGNVVFDSYWRTSRFIESRIEAFSDIHFDVASRVMREMERRLGRGWNRTFTVGGGTNEPWGIALTGKDVSGGAGSADDGSGGIDYANLLEMEYAIDLAYLQDGEGGPGGFTDAHGGMIGWMMNRNVEKVLRSATLFPAASQTSVVGVTGYAGAVGGLPIWVPDPTNAGIATQRAPGLILGYPYTINNHMGTGKAGTDYTETLNKAGRDDAKVTPLLFGSCGHFGVRNIGGPMYYRFWDSETAKRMAVKFIGWSRRDSRSRGPHLALKQKAGLSAATGIENEAYCTLSVVA